MLLENVAWFLLGAGVTSLIWFGIFLVPVMRRRRYEKKFASFVERVKNAVADAEAPIRKNKEISELQFRDRDGALCKVQIVIDHEIELSDDDKIGLKGMIDRGEASVAGSLKGVLSGHKISEGAMDKVQQFVFSAKAVEQMRASGMEPDEVVRSMLKSSGRIA